MAQKLITPSPSKLMSLRQTAYQRIKKDIINCKLEPGEQLSENYFAELFQISKTPVREALTSLQQENLVEYKRNRGFTVATITLKDIQEIYEARIFFESTLLKLAIKHITAQEIEKLAKYLEIQCDWDHPESIEAYIQANTDFHLGIAIAAHNSHLYRAYTSLLDNAQRLIYLDLKNNNVFETWNNSHKRFLDAIRNHDAEAGVLAIEEVMANSKRRILGN
jgi:DNA-binding GntR family transcriptional regulator